MNRISLKAANFTDRINPLHWFGNADRTDVRLAWRRLSKEYTSDKKASAKIIKLIYKDIEAGSMPSLEKDWASLTKYAGNRIENVRKCLMPLFLSTRREFLALQQIRRKESNKHFEDEELELMKAILSHTNTWFGLIASHQSFTWHASDLLNLQKETVHLLDQFNLQPSARKVSNKENRVKKDAGKTGEKSDKREQTDIKALQEQLKSHYSKLDIFFKDIVKVMLLEIQENANTQNTLLQKLASQNYPKERLAILQSKTGQEQKLYENSFKELQETMNSLINLERAA